jgi:hypothetical protein
MARLGNIIYWLGCVIAVVVIAYPFFFIVSEWGNYELAPPDPWSVGAYVVGGAAIWLIARAAKYVLARR